jgi:hypothetical protein
MASETKKYKFWLFGSGGQRHEEKIVELPSDYTDADIKDEIDDWKYNLRCNSEYIRYGWDLVVDVTL